MARKTAFTADWDASTSPQSPRLAAESRCRYWNTANDIGGDATAVVSGVGQFNELNLTGLISNLGQFGNVASVIGDIDLGDVGALVGPQLVSEIGLADLQALVTEVDLFNVADLSHDQS